MSDSALSIAASGLNAAQTAMDTIAQNLANANTPGYVDETANLVANPGGDPYGVGDGTSVAGVGQNSDGLLAASNQQTQGALSQATALQSVLQLAQSSFPEPSTSGLSADLSSFWQSWDNIAQNPTDPGARAAVVDGAQTLVTDFQQAAQQIDTVSANASSQLSGAVSQANQMLDQVATLNGQIEATIGAGSPPNALIDQRNQVMDQLAQTIGAVGVPQADGSLNVSVGGVTLVQGNWSDTLKLGPGPSGQQIVAQTSKTALPATSGTTAGLLAAINQYLPGFTTQLNTAANDLISTVNTQLESGYTATGAQGTALFTGSGAAGIGVSSTIVANPQLIAASSTSTLPDATNNGANAQAMANLYDSPTGPDQAYRGLIESIGSQVQSVNSQVQSQSAVATAVQQNLQAATGVNPNTEMVNLMNFQQSYQASAKVISTVDAAIQSLMAAV